MREGQRVELFQIIRIEKIDYILAGEKLRRAGEHRKAVAGSVLIDEDEVGIRKFLAESSRLFGERAVFRKKDTMTPGRKLENEEAEENKADKEEALASRLGDGEDFL